MARRVLIGWLILLGIIACEPLAPEVTQDVIIVTSEGQPAITETPLSSGAVPERPTLIPTFTPSPSPTPMIIPTATVPPCNATEGTLIETSFASQITGQDLPYNLYLPPCFFQSGRRYPYLILLHDEGATAQQWIDLGIPTVMDNALSADLPALAPLVIIMPEGGELKADDSFVVGETFEDVILGELIPDLERNFCLWSARRSIGGVGRGGFWAFSIAFRYPEEFLSVGGHSPQFAPDNAPNTHNPMALAERATGIETLQIYLDNAQNDAAGANIAVLSNALQAREIAHRYVINPVGGSTQDYWASQLETYLTFYSQGLPLNVAELPSCQE